MEMLIEKNREKSFRLRKYKKQSQPHPHLSENNEAQIENIERIDLNLTIKHCYDFS